MDAVPVLTRQVLHDSIRRLDYDTRKRRFFYLWHDSFILVSLKDCRTLKHPREYGGIVESKYASIFYDLYELLDTQFPD